MSLPGEIDEARLEKGRRGIAAIQAWAWPAGTEVTVRESEGRETSARTRTVPWLSTEGDPVVLLEGRLAPVLLAQVSVKGKQP